MGTTASQILTLSYQDCGIIAQNETISGDPAMAQDGLRRLNNMVSGWRTQFGTVLAVERTIFALTDNKQTYTIGLGGDFNVPRPVNSIPGAGLLLNGLSSAATVTLITRSALVATVMQTAHGLAVGDEVLIAGATQIDYNGLQTVASVIDADTYTYALDATPVTPATGTITAAAILGEPVEIPTPVITDDMYQNINLKNLPNSQFTNIYYNPSAGPLGTVTLWPKPNTAINQLVLYLQNAFTGFADLTTAYDYPEIPGYAEALQYNLDLRLFTPYGVKDGAIIGPLQQMAVDTLMLIKRANNKLVDLQTDARVLTSASRSGYNINTGTGG
jgi:hypothetical protein